jgi:O-methyltransferase domain
MPSAADRETAAETRDAVNAAIFHVRCNRVLGTLVERRVPDLLDNGPMPVTRLGRLAGLHPLSLERSLRLLAGFGVFVEVEPGVFANNDASALLRDHPGGLRNWTLYATSRFIWDAWGAADHAMQTGDSAFVRAHGVSLWEYLRAHPDDDAVFNAMFAELWMGAHEAIAAAYDWSGAETVVDVGGGNGSLLATILEPNVHLRGIVVDQASVIPQAEAHLASRGVRERCELLAGDFFDRIPATGDVWLLSQILHDWDDRRSGLILENCRASMRSQDQLLVVEAVTVPCEPNRLVGLADVNMLTLFGEARQRTEAEYRDLFRLHGLELVGVVPTESAFSLVEARPR